MISKVKSLLRPIARRIKPQYRITQPHFPAAQETLIKPLLVVCGPGFNQNIQIAGTLMRVGFARGWAETVGPARLVAANKLIQTLDEFDSPAIFMSVYDFCDHPFSYSDLKRLRSTDLFVWVSVHPRSMGKIQRLAPLINESEIEREMNAYARVVAAEPKFVWNAFGEAAEEWQRGWRDDGYHWETIWPAADTQRYFPEPAREKYGNIKIAYVGGYWAEKAQAFDQYLRPWEDILHTFGYAKWPYKNYGGGLDEREERRLYSSAGLIPLVTTPLGWLLAEITERYLKAPACGAFCIADQNPSLREIFSENEMLQAKSAEQFQEMVREFLADKIDVKTWAMRGYEAVQSRHLYSHRALQIKTVLEKIKK